MGSRTPNGAMERPSDKATPGDHSEGKEGESGTDGNEYGSFGKGRLLHIGCIGGGRDGDGRNSETCGCSGEGWESW